MPEEVEDNIDHVQAKRRLAAFQLANETDSDSGAIRQILLSHLQRFALLAHKVGYWILIHIRTRSVVNHFFPLEYTRTVTKSNEFQRE